jgi:dimethylglycine dehydrogenase
VTPGSEVHVYLLGKPHKATVLAKPPFDPEGARLRA